MLFQKTALRKTQLAVSGVWLHLFIRIVPIMVCSEFNCIGKCRSEVATWEKPGYGLPENRDNAGKD